MHNALAIYIQDSFPSYYSHPQLFQPEGCHQPSYSGVPFVNLALLGWACQRQYQEDGNIACLLEPAGNQSGGGGVTPHMVVVLLSFTGLTSHLGLFLFCLKFSTLSVSCSQHFSQVEVSKVEM